MNNIVSFGSTYKVSNQNNKNFVGFQQLCVDKRMNEGVAVDFKDSMSSKPPYNYSVTYTMVAPDDMDNEIETYCANNGIQFTKLTNKELLSPSRIDSSIAAPEKDYKLVKINAKKVEELAKTQETNLEHCEKDYKQYYDKQVDFMLKSGNDIQTSTLYINPNGSQVEDTLDYISKYGADNLNKDQIIIDFAQRTSDPDHCVFFALKDAGFENIPVYVNDDTYKLANALGLIEE